MTERQPLPNLAAAARSVREMWQHKTGEYLPSTWDPTIINWVERFGLPLVSDAVQAVADSGFSEDGKRHPAAVLDIPRYATVEQAEAAEPGMKDCYFIRGRMREKFYTKDDEGPIIGFLSEVMRGGMSVSAMHQAVDDNETLEDCFAQLGVDRTVFRVAMGHPIVDRPVRHQVFISEHEPEWRLWDAYLRKTTGRGSPMNKHFGWHFPTRTPPVEQTPRRRSHRPSDAKIK